MYPLTQGEYQLLQHMLKGTSPIDQVEEIVQQVIPEDFGQLTDEEQAIFRSDLRRALATVRIMRQSSPEDDLNDAFNPEI